MVDWISTKESPMGKSWAESAKFERLFSQTKGDNTPVSYVQLSLNLSHCMAFVSVNYTY